MGYAVYDVFILVYHFLLKLGKLRFGLQLDMLRLLLEVLLG